MIPRSLKKAIRENKSKFFSHHSYYRFAGSGENHFSRKFGEKMESARLPHWQFSL